MPNNLIFNDVASSLQTQIFGKNGSNIVPVSVDSSGNFMVSTVTTIVSSGSITVQGGTIDVVSALSAGTVTVRGGTIDVVSALSAGTVTVSGGTIDVVSALTAGTVTVQGGTIQTVPVYTSTNTTVLLSTTATVDALTADTSAQKMYSFYVNNIGTVNTVTALLRISPVDTGTYYVNDSSTSYSIPPGSAAVLVPAKYLNYTKLQLIANAAPATALVYYNSQS